MKPTTNPVESIWTMPGERIAMGVDARGMNTVLSILSNMYGDTGLAVVREYSCNALDSQRESGNDLPILVTSPSPLDPRFIVQDFGVGLSKEEVLNVYAQYGVSTKRDSNDQIGAFGIGAKSAFTAGSQFTVTAVKDGMQTIALFSLDEEGAPTVTIVSHNETDEPNGVRVEIGVRDVDGVNRAIDRLFPYWEQGTVEVDGVEPASIWPTLDKLDDGVFMKLTQNYDSSETWTVVMGGVPYPVPSTIIDKLRGRTRQVAMSLQFASAAVTLVVPIGAVDITPSREELRDTDKTVAALTGLIDRFDASFHKWVVDQVSGAKSIVEAITKLHTLRSKFGREGRELLRGVTWGGQSLDVLPAVLVHAPWFKLRHKRGYYPEKVARRELGIQISPNLELAYTVFITDVPLNRVRSVQLASKAFLTEEAKDKENGALIVVAMTDEVKIDSSWLKLSDPTLRKISYDQFIKDWKPAPAPRQPKSEIIYELWGMGNVKTVAELNAEKEVFYLTRGEERSLNTRTELFRQMIGRAPLVLLKSTQKPEPFLKRVPHAKNAYHELHNYARKFVLTMSQTDADIIAATNFVHGVGSSVATSIATKLLPQRHKITNKKVRDALDLFESAQKIAADSNSRMATLRDACRLIGHDVNTKASKHYDPALWVDVFSRLPLLTAYYQVRYLQLPLGDEHAILYVNAVNL